MASASQELEVSFENELTYHHYATNDRLEAFHEAYEDGLEEVRGWLGEFHPLRIGSESVESDRTFTVHSPGELDLTVGEFTEADSGDVDRAVETAEEMTGAWQSTSVDERVEYFRSAADIMADRKFSLAALITIENGKNRTEAIADVDEAIDFLRWYSDEFGRADGYVVDAGEPLPGEHCTNRLRPYGVFGVIAPFNFPLAILTGMTTGTIITGNTAVVKPGERTPLIAHALLDIFETAGIPDGVVNLVTGRGSTTGQAIVDHPDVDGIVFTGSLAVGRSIQERFFELDKPGPVIAEMGGKNSVIVTETADLDKAVDGISYGAFGFSGQKCSATSRVYAVESEFETLRDRLIEEATAIPDHPPHHRDAVLSPVIDEDAIDRYDRICAEASSVGTVHTGGRRVEDSSLPRGRYVRPTVVTGVPHDHWLAREEHFLPFVTLHPVTDLDEALTKANDSDFALCAGLFAEDEDEIDRWFDTIEAGMTYVNREQSATTGALVGAQPFGGWKHSGTTAKFAGGRWYLPQFMREQSQTRVRR